MDDASAARLTVLSTDDPRAVQLTGDIDSHTAEDLEDHLESLGVQADVVLGLEGVGFIDSSGLRVLIGAHQRLEDAGNRLVLRSASDAVVRLVEITGLTDHLHLE